MTVRRVLALPVAVALAGGAVSGCGDAEDPAPQAPAASKAEELVAAAADAFAKVRSYRFEGVSVDDDGRSRQRVDVSADGRLRSTGTSRDGELSIIALGTTTYLKGDRRFWLRLGGSYARRNAAVFTGRWVKTPPSLGAPYLEDIKQLLPKSIAHCLPYNHGRLSIAGQRTFKGRKVTIVEDDGNAPGGTPVERWYAASGPPLLLRELVHGEGRPGGANDPLCESPGSTLRRSSYRVSRYNRVPRIVAPKNALELGRQGSGAPGGLSA